jgi:hypothetical protein
LVRGGDVSISILVVASIIRLEISSDHIDGLHPRRLGTSQPKIR